jgi:NADP-dependent 3-hydroxy acid dehydrogenase YdfG
LLDGNRKFASGAQDEDIMAEPLVVITGAGSGIGLALAEAFAKEGNALLLIARHMKPLPDLSQDRIAYAEADVADYGAVERAIRDAEARFGKTEGLINNAGLVDARDFKSVEPASYAHEIDVNLKGVLNCTKVAIGDMSACRHWASPCARPRAATACA